MKKGEFVRVKVSLPRETYLQNRFHTLLYSCALFDLISL